MRVVIAGGGTGGHLMPALAVASALVELRPDVEPVLVGARRGVEATLLPQRPYRFHLLPLEPIYRRQWWRNLRWPWVVWRVMRQCSQVLSEEQPAFVFGTGGYAAGPILYQAIRRGIPVALQEQNAFPGITTRWLARRARQVHLGFPEAAAHLRVGPTTVVHQHGNPIVAPPDPRPDPAAAREKLGLRPERRVILVMGGSQGARAINEAIRPLLDAGGFPDAALLWSTGRRDWDRYRRYDNPPQRQVRAFWDPVGDAYGAADLVLARAGAMTTAELCAWRLPAVYVPLPGAAAAHQSKNAQALAAAGAALRIEESDLETEDLAALLAELLRDRARLEAMGAAAEARGRPQAARETASELIAMVS